MARSDRGLSAVQSETACRPRAAAYQSDRRAMLAIESARIVVIRQSKPTPSKLKLPDSFYFRQRAASRKLDCRSSNKAFASYRRYKSVLCVGRLAQAIVVDEPWQPTVSAGSRVFRERCIIFLLQKFMFI